MKMHEITMVTGGLLIALGVGGYLATGAHSPTALIPAFFGLLFSLCAWIGRKEKMRRHMMHAAAGLALIGCVGTARALATLPALLSGAEVQRPAAVVLQSVACLIFLAFLVLAIRSFILARRASK